MNIYEINDIGNLIRDNSYVGRGIIIGKSADSTKAVWVDEASADYADLVTVTGGSVIVAP